MDALTKQNYHLVGIQGVGMTALAHILSDRGARVTGSDTGERFGAYEFLSKRGIEIFDSFNAQNIQGCDVVVYTGAHGGCQNPEVIVAKEKGIVVFSLAEFIALLTKTKKTIAIAGCHGKTTTTALMALALESLGMHPSWFVGAPSFGGKQSGKWDNGEYFVVEADEYVVDPQNDLRPKLSLYTVEDAIITSFDHDHPDVYPTIDDVRHVFQSFIASTHRYVVGNGNDNELSKMISSDSSVLVTHPDDFLHGIELLLIGEHNRMNAALVIALLKKIGIKQFPEDIFHHFTGAKRRLELVGKGKGWILYDDYAHHPTEIRASIAALRIQYPDAAIHVLFQPHTYSRTAAYADDFASALSDADSAYILPIFSSKRENKDQFSITSIDIAAKNSDKLTAGLPSELEAWIRKKTTNNSIFVTMGAGDVNEFDKKIITICNNIV